MDFEVEIFSVHSEMPFLVLVFGGLTIISLLTKTGLERFSLPPILGYFWLAEFSR